MEHGPPLSVKVWGDYACFTRPENKVERVSYPVMTPSAARGLLEAIFWKPEFSWRVRQIEVLKPIRHFSILRNEVSTKMSPRLPSRNYYAEEDRAQRHTLALRDVAYVIRADIHLRPHAQNVHPAKYRDQFRRRVSRGQYHHTPYLGCREFAAWFGEPGRDDRPIDLSDDLGLILFDLEYLPRAQGRGKPIFFNARLDNGILAVPQDLYPKGGD